MAIFDCFHFILIDIFRGQSLAELRSRGLSCIFATFSSRGFLPIARYFIYAAAFDIFMTFYAIITDGLFAIDDNMLAIFHAAAGFVFSPASITLLLHAS